MNEAITGPGSTSGGLPTGPWGLRRTMAIAIPLTVLGFLVAITYFGSQDTRLKLSKAKGGECVVLGTPLPADNAVVGELHQTACSKSHNAEVYARFRYPGAPAPGSPTPEANCNRPPDGTTAAQLARFDRFMSELARQGAGRLYLTNNADTAADRDYVCLATFAPRTGRLLQQVAEAAASGP